jgi:hypothetical protein
MSILGDQWSFKERIPDLAANLIAYNDNCNKEEKVLETAIMIFNEKPNQGVKFCLQNELIKKHNDVA